MLEPNNYIVKQPKLEDSQNYALLRKTGLKHIEKLAREYWTDYNVHDPGITLLELLCYAITDLGYRTGYDIKDILTEEVNGEPVNNSFFHTARDIFPTNPVTFSDLRKLLIDITGVKQAWIGKNENVRYWLDRVDKVLRSAPDKIHYECCAPLNGLFDVLLEYEDFVNTTEEGRIVRVGKRAEAADTDHDVYQSPTAAEGLAFKVRHPITLRSVSIYAEGAAITDEDNVVIHILKADENGDYVLDYGTFTHTVDTANVKTTVPLQVKLEPGDYRIHAQDTAVDLLYTHEPAGEFDHIQYPYTILNVVDIEGAFDGGSPDKRYYYFFDWEISFAVSPVEQETLLLAGRIEAQTGLADKDVMPGGDFLNVGTGSNIRMAFNALCPFTLQSLDLYAETASAVNLLLLDKQNNLIAELTDYPLEAGLNTVPLEWEIQAGLYYQLNVQRPGGAPTLRLYRNSGISDLYPISLDQAIEIPFCLNNTGIESTNLYFFFYNWKISYRPCPLQTTQITKQDILLAVRNRLHLTRNLCEDFVHIRDLKVEKIAICADIELTPSADLVEVMAEIMYQMELYVSPPVNFYTIEELQEKGKTTDQIFEGPLLDHGFIDDEAFQAIERRCFLRTSDIIQIIMDVEGVTAVKSILIISLVERTEDNPAQPGDQIVELNDKEYIYREEPWILHLQDQNFFAPDFESAFSKIFFYKKGLPYLANREKVEERLNEKRAQQIRNKLKGHEQDLPVPVGEYKDLEDFYPVQNDLPETYLAGQNRAPDNRGKLRKAQSNQLKGYLLFFEQIFANYLSQLAHIKELFSWEKDANKTYFTQKLGEVADLSQLYRFAYDRDPADPDTPSELENRLEEIIESNAVAEDRKNRFLDHLIGRFSEDLTEYGLLMYSLFKKQAAQRLILDKQAFLADYPRVSSQRGKGFDYRYPAQYDNLTGFQRRIYRLIGIYDEDCEVGRRNFANPNFVIDTVLIDGEEYFVYQLLDNDGGTVLFESIPCREREQICVLLDSNLVFAADDNNWFLSDDGTRWELRRICRRGEEETNELLGWTENISTADDTELREKVIAQFAEYADREGFHVVEHILLRKRSWEADEIEEDARDFMPIELHTEGVECDCVEVRAPYSFRASVILPSWPSRFQSIRFRQYVEELLRLEAPAHVYLKICWISHCEMLEFEKCHDAWLEAHAQLPHDLRGETPLPQTDTVPPDDAPDWEDQLEAYQAKFDLWYDAQPEEPEALRKAIFPLHRDKTINNEEEKTLAANYRLALVDLIKKLHSLTNVFPTARLHDCEDIDSEEPQVTLNNTNLGSL